MIVERKPGLSISGVYDRLIGLSLIHISKLGVQFPTGEPITYPFGIRNFYVADPEGNLLEIGSTDLYRLSLSLIHIL